MVLSQRLLERGINVLPIIHPAVPAKASRLRFFLTSMHSEDEIEAAIAATAEEFAGVQSSKLMLRVPTLQS